MVRAKLPKPLPATFATTRAAVHSLACYAVAPARKARTGRIGLRSVGDAIGTPPFDDGTRIVVRGDHVAHEPGESTAITTVRAACTFLAVTPSSDPGVGSDLPPYEPDQELDVDAGASRALASWYAFGDALLAEVARDRTGVSEAQLWPEHFDLAITVDPGAGVSAANVGFSPGDAFSPEPYVYVGPDDMSRLEGEYWNAPFGATCRYTELAAAADASAHARAFIADGLDRVRAAS